MTPTEEMLGVHVGLRKYRGSHEPPGEGSEVELKSTVEIFGIHGKFTGDTT